MGADGCLVRAGTTGRARQIGVTAGEVIDVTGAGDAFCGGFAAGLALGLDAVEAARRGVVSAGFAVAGFSSIRLASLSPADAARRLLAPE